MTPITDSTYELRERTCLFSLVQPYPAPVFFDIGAHTGLYSIPFAQQFPTSRVYAFEPIPTIRRQLHENVARLGLRNIFVFPLGLSDRQALVDFHYSPADPGATSLAPLEPRFGPTTMVRAAVTTIDELSDLHPVPTVIKCDVEGAELLVFRGGLATLRRHRPIIQCELLRKWSRRFGYHPNEVIALLGGIGYDCFVLHESVNERGAGRGDGEGGVSAGLEATLTPLNTITDDAIETNFFFLPKENWNE